MAFIFGGNTGASYEDIQRKRDIAAALASSMGTPRNVGEGLTAIGKALAIRGMNKRADEADAKNRAEFDKKWGALFGGGSTTPVVANGGSSYVPVAPYTPPDPSSPEGIAADTMTALGKGAPSQDQIAAYIAESATARGVDPSVAVAVARSEGLGADPSEAWQSRVVKDGKRERSYGPFQLYIDGGLGNQFMESTGLDPRDTSTWRQQVDFALDHASKNGWGAWYGAKNTGIGNFQGISGGPERLTQAGGMDIGTLAEVAGSPYASAGQKAVAQALLQQQMQANDPRAALELELLRKQVDDYGKPKPSQPTDDMREYEFAKAQGFEGTFTDFMTDMRKAGANSTTVNVGNGAPGLGKLSTDFGYVLDPATGQPVIDPATGLPKAAPVPGSPAAVEAQARAEAEAKAAEHAATQKQTRSNVVTQTTGAIRDMLDGGGSLDLPEVGVIGSRLTGINQEAADMAGLLDTLKGMVAFDRLEALKNASANGASGLGQVTEREIALLAAQLGALDQSISPDRLRATLDNIEGVFARMSPEAQAFLLGETNQLPPAGAQPAAPSAPPRLRFNPETGELEPVQ